MNSLRPTPRWVRVTAVVTVVLTALLLTVGGLVTSFRAGMADVVWPRAPLFLLFQNWQEMDFGVFIEHLHRLLGLLTGLAAITFAGGTWVGEPDRKLRLAGLVAVAGLVAAYGDLHGRLERVSDEIKQKVLDQKRQEGAGGDLTRGEYEGRLAASNVLADGVRWPVVQGLATAVLAVAVLFFGAAAAARRTPGGWVRLTASAALVAVMVQGLLGGFRVLLNSLAGTYLAAVHGVFGQVAFAVLVAALTLSAPRRDGDALPTGDREPLFRLAWVTVGVLFLQLVWAVWVRHYGSAVAQRLHILTAFAATGVLVWLAAKVLLNPAAKGLFRGAAVHLLFIVGVQVTLGVESYLGKFVAAGPQAQKLPEERTVTRPQAVTRTAHQLIGAALLASAVAFAVRVGRRPLRPALPLSESVEVRDRAATVPAPAS